MSYVPGTRTPLALDSAPLCLWCSATTRNRTVPRVVDRDRAALALTAWSAYSVGAQLPVIKPSPSFLGPVLGAVIVDLVLSP